MDAEGAQPATAAAQHNARIVLDISGTSPASAGPTTQELLSPRTSPLSGIVFRGHPDKGRPWVSGDIEEAK